LKSVSFRFFISVYLIYTLSHTYARGLMFLSSVLRCPLPFNYPPEFFLLCQLYSGRVIYSHSPFTIRYSPFSHELHINMRYNLAGHRVLSR
jgi:hypothetical protein